MLMAEENLVEMGQEVRLLCRALNKADNRVCFVMQVALEMVKPLPTKFSQALAARGKETTTVSPTSCVSAGAKQEPKGVGLREQLLQQLSLGLFVVAQRLCCKDVVLQCDVRCSGHELCAVGVYELTHVHSLLRP